MAINQRKKGARGEMMGINFFEEWTNLSFKRSPASGGLRGHVVEYTVGDIVCVENNYIFPLSVEIKNVKGINFNHLLYDVKSDIIEYWNQCYKDSERSEKVPILLMRYNGLPKAFFFVVLEYKDYKALNLKLDTKMAIRSKGFDLLITTTDCLKTNKWKKFNKLATKLRKKKWRKVRQSG